MGGIFGRKKKAAPVAQEPIKTETETAVERQEERAAVQEEAQMQGVQRRRRLRRSGGMRLLFSPLKLEGPNQAQIKNKLGG